MLFINNQWCMIWEFSACAYNMSLWEHALILPFRGDSQIYPCYNALDYSFKSRMLVFVLRSEGIRSG